MKRIYFLLCPVVLIALLSTLSNDPLDYSFINSYYKDLNKKTWHYYNKYNFELNPIPGHAFWDVEADAFKHAFGGAELDLRYGQILDTSFCILNELRVKKNPVNEWNMDSWNHNQGREIAKEIKKEYGKNYKKLSPSQKDDIIAEKVMIKMRGGDLILYPEDTRKYSGFWENIIHKIKLTLEGRSDEISD